MVQLAQAPKAAAACCWPVDQLPYELLATAQQTMPGGSMAACTWCVLQWAAWLKVLYRLGAGVLCSHSAGGRSLLCQRCAAAMCSPACRCQQHAWLAFEQRCGKLPGAGIMHLPSVTSVRAHRVGVSPWHQVLTGAQLESWVSESGSAEHVHVHVDGGFCRLYTGSARGVVNHCKVALSSSKY